MPKTDLNAQEHETSSRGSVALSAVWLELCIALILLGVFAFYFYEATQLRSPRNPADVGPAAFPKLVAGGSLFCLAILVVRLVWNGVLKGEKRRVLFERAPWVSLAAAALLLTAYFFEFTGPIVASALCSAVIVFAGGERRPLILIAAPLGMAAGIYVLFVVLLGVRFY